LKPIVDSKSDDIFTFSFTSGTTGVPKAVMIPNLGMTSTINAAVLALKITQNDVHCSFLPLSHIFERLVFCSLFFSGAKIIFFGGDVLKIRDDWQLVKPSLMAVVPRLLNRFLIK